MSKPTVLIVQGPGFEDQGDLIVNLRTGGYTVKTAFLSYDAPAKSLPDFHDAGVIVLRAPWTTSSEEKLFARLLAVKLKPSFDILKKRLAGPNPPKVFAVGRGAMTYLLSGFIAEAEIEKHVDWQPALQKEGPFIELLYKEDTFYGLVQGRTLPRIQKPETLGLQGLVNYGNDIVVWAHKMGPKNEPGGSAFLAFVDIFACAERSQLVNFGYEDLMRVRTQVQVFEALCGVP